MAKNQVFRNCPDWVSNPDDYQLVFMPVDDVWREVGHTIPVYNNMLLADYLSKMELYIPDYTQFLRIVHPDYYLEYRSFGARVRIDYKKREFVSQIP